MYFQIEYLPEDQALVWLWSHSICFAATLKMSRITCFLLVWIHVRILWIRLLSFSRSNSGLAKVVFTADIVMKCVKKKKDTLNAIVAVKQAKLLKLWLYHNQIIHNIMIFIRITQWMLNHLLVFDELFLHKARAEERTHCSTVVKHYWGDWRSSHHRCEDSKLHH